MQHLGKFGLCEVSLDDSLRLHLSARGKSLELVQLQRHVSLPSSTSPGELFAGAFIGQVYVHLASDGIIKCSAKPPRRRLPASWEYKQ